MSYLLTMAMIILGLYGFTNPEKLLNRKNRNLIKNGKPLINDYDIFKNIKKIRLISIVTLVCGMIVVFCNIMLLNV